ncbi:MAG TPA: extracellular solute-binding protein [Pseudonocardiaceae bacterium]
MRAGLRRGLATGLAGVLGVIAGVVGTTVVHDDTRRAEVGLPAGELVLMSGEDETDGGQHQVLIDQWNQLHPGNPARIVSLDSNATAARLDMVGAVQSHERVDVLNLDIAAIAEFAHHGWIRPLDESRLDTSGFLEKPLASGRYDNRLWALPFNTDAGLLFRRSDLVEPARSWAELESQVERFFADQGRAPGVEAGYAGQLDEYEGLTVNVLEAVQDVADRPMVQDGRVAVTADDLARAVDRLRPAGPDGVPVVLPDAIDFDEGGTTRAFLTGRVLTMRNWPIAYRELDNAVPRPEFEVDPLPGGSVLGGQSLAVTAHSENPVAAQALIEFLTDSRSQQLLFQRGGFAPSRTVVYHDAEVRGLYPYAEALLEAVNSAQPRPVTHCYWGFSRELAAMASRALTDGTPLPDDAVDRLDAALRC